MPGTVATGAIITCSRGVKGFPGLEGADKGNDISGGGGFTGLIFARASVRFLTWGRIHHCVCEFS